MTLANIIARSRREKEAWRYTDIEKLLPSFASAPPLAAAKAEFHPPATRFQHRLVFIDGVFSPGQSQYADLPPGILQGDRERGYTLALAGQTCLVTAPIKALFITTGAGEVANKFTVELGPSGRLTLIERHEAPEGAAAHVMETDIKLHPQAKLVHGKIVKGGANAAHIATTRARIAEGAYYDHFSLLSGGRLVRDEIEARLEGRLAQCALNGIMLAKGQDHLDTSTRIIHAVPDGTSRQMYKSVLDEKAHAVFQGKILVEKGAQKTDGHQLSRALLLSDQAEMDAKPELEIYADDVKCSHGSTVGDLDGDAMFYLRARGIGEDEARQLLIAAFIGEMLDSIRVEELRDLCAETVKGWFHD